MTWIGLQVSLQVEEDLYIQVEMLWQYLLSPFRSNCIIEEFACSSEDNQLESVQKNTHKTQHSTLNMKLE